MIKYFIMSSDEMKRKCVAQRELWRGVNSYIILQEDCRSLKVKLVVLEAQQESNRFLPNQQVALHNTKQNGGWAVLDFSWAKYISYSIALSVEMLSPTVYTVYVIIFQKINK